MAEAVRGFLPVVINGVEGFITAGSVDDGLAVLTFARYGPTDAAGSTATTPAAIPIPVASHTHGKVAQGVVFGLCRRPAPSLLPVRWCYAKHGHGH